MSSIDPVAVTEKTMNKLNRMYDITRRVTSAFGNLGAQIKSSFQSGAEYIESLKKDPAKLNRFKDELWAVSKVAGMAAYQAYQSVTRFMDNTQELFNRQVRYELQLDTVMTNNGAGTEEIERIRQSAAALQGLTTYGDASLLAGAGELGGYIKSAAALEGMMSVMADYAAGVGGMNVQPDKMAEYAAQLGKAMQGSFAEAEKQGLVFTEAQKEIMKTGDEMERVSALTEAVSRAWGGLAQMYAQAPEGGLIMMKNSLENIGEAIGARVITRMVALREAVVQLASSPAMQGFITWMTRGLNIIVSGVVGLIKCIEAVGNFMVNNWAVVGPIMAALNFFITSWVVSLLPKLAGAVWALIAPLRAVGAGFMAVATSSVLIWGIAAAIAVVVFGVKTLGWNLAEITERVGFAIGYMHSFVGSILGSIANVAVTAFEIVMSIAKFVSQAFTTVVYGVIEGFLKIGKVVGKVLAPILGTEIAVGADLKSKDMWADAKAMWSSPLYAQSQWEGFDTSDPFDKARKAGEAWAEGGRDFGQNISDKISNTAGGLFDGSLQTDALGTFGLSGMSLPGAGELELAMPADFYGGVDLDIGRVEAVGHIEDNINLAQEDIKLLRDVAEARVLTGYGSNSDGPMYITMGDIHNREDASYILREIGRMLGQEHAVAAAVAKIS